MILFLLMLIRSVMSSDLCNSIEEVAVPANRSSADFVDTLFRWCVSDVGCRRLYFQDIKENATVFSILLKKHVRFNASFDENTASRSLFCNNGEASSFSPRDSWLLFLKNSSNNAEKPIFCDINHQLAFDSTLTPNCICIPGRVCTDQLYSLTFYHVFVVLLSIASAILLVLGAYVIASMMNAVPKVANAKGVSREKKTKQLYDLLEKPLST
jgi:hypothetical protein